MGIGTYNVELIENQHNSFTVTYPNVNSTTGWAASADIRASDSPSSLLVESFAPSLTIVSNNLVITLELTETETDSVAEYLASGNRAYWSLKLTPPDNKAIHILKGTVSIVRTVTP